MPSNSASSSHPNNELESAFDAHLDSQPFFEAGEAFGDDDHRRQNAWAGSDDAPPYAPAPANDDPLGASSSARGDAPPSVAQAPAANAAASAATPGGTAGYDFERPSYFSRAPSAASISAPASRHPTRPSSPTNAGAESNISLNQTHGGAAATLTSMASASSQLPAIQGASRSISSFRQSLGRFGRFVGMRIPGSTNYATLAQDDPSGAAAGASGAGNPSGGAGPSRGGVVRSGRVMGSGLGQDGVFANLNAKPERRRRRAADGDDRGDDDDLVDDVQPPTYETAAADAAPPYWETTIIGGPGGLGGPFGGYGGWTPGGTTIGAVEDLIVEGLPIGNYFGFAWNLLVSMSFQFVGFLLTYLLHTTHAARCGSQAGLGISLIQYGFFLRSQPERGTGRGGPGEGGPTGGDGEALNPVDTAAAQATDAAARLVARFVTDHVIPASTHFARSFITLANGGNATMADAMAASADAPISAHPGPLDGGPPLTADDGNNWLSYLLMMMGWMILLSSLLSYWRVHRWGTRLVAAARLDAERSAAVEEGNAEGQPATASSDEEDGQGADGRPVGFLNAWRAFYGRRRAERERRLREAGSGPEADPTSGGAAGARPTGTGEDWIIYPGSTALGPRSTRGLGTAGPLGLSTSGRGTGADDARSPLGTSSTLFAIDSEGEDDSGDDSDEERIPRRARPNRGEDGSEGRSLLGGADGGEETRYLSPEERRLVRDLRGAGFLG